MAVIDAKERKRERRISRLEWKWKRRVLTNTFIVWQLTATVVWLSNSGSVLRLDLLRFVRPYVAATGIMQNWSMFSPNPDNRDLFVQTVVHYASGRIRYWDYPRMANMDYFTRYRRERFRKLIEISHLDQSSMFWPSLAVYAARVNQVPNDPVIRVDLVRHWRIIPPPGNPMPNYQTFQFFSKVVSPEDLR